MSDATCSDEEGCDRPAIARRLCLMHYKRWRKSGRPLPPPMRKPRQFCKVDEGDGPCGDPVQGHDMCGKHYKRWRKHDDPLGGDPVRSRVRGAREAYFWSKVDKNGPIPAYRPELGPCWLWTDRLTKARYGVFSVSNRPYSVHRFSYEVSVGPIPDGYEVDHVCHPSDRSCLPATCLHRRCVNPAHLAAVTSAENNRRSTSPTAINERKTHCKYGHEFTPENTYTVSLRNGRFGRACRECQRRRRAESAARKRARKVREAA